tara:strand:- start:417 stop:770 length:354 start_codon:yes stop_codon:yes gene_type:complete
METARPYREKSMQRAIEQAVIGSQSPCLKAFSVTKIRGIERTAIAQKPAEPSQIYGVLFLPRIGQLSDMLPKRTLEGAINCSNASPPPTRIAGKANSEIIIRLSMPAKMTARQPRHP